MSSNGVDYCIANDTDTVKDKSLPDLFADETELEDDFGEQSMEGPIAVVDIVGSVVNRRKSNVSNLSLSLHSQSRHTSMGKSFWHGSCASFLGSSDELLDLSSSSCNLEESMSFLSLQSSTVALNKMIVTKRVQEGNKKTASSVVSGHQREATYDSIPDASKNPFGCCESDADISDSLPRKPIRLEDHEYDDNDDTAKMTEHQFYNLEKRLIVLDKILQTSTVLVENMESTLLKHPIAENTSSSKPRSDSLNSHIEEIEKHCYSLHNPSMSLQRSKSTASFFTDDTAPKCPIRRPSPIRSRRYINHSMYGKG